MSKADISKYISQLSPMEQKVLHIAVSHLETSFSLSKSIGFQEWLRDNKPLQSPQQPPKEEQPQPPKKASKIKIKKKLPSV